MNDFISRQTAIDVLNDGAELLRRVLDETDVEGIAHAVGGRLASWKLALQICRFAQTVEQK